MACSSITRRAMYVQHNIAALSCNHCVQINMCYIFWLCVCSLRYPSYNAHAPYYHLRSARLYNILSHYLTNFTIFRKKNYWTWNVCFDFLYQFSPKKFLILRKFQRNIINLHLSSCKASAILVRFSWNSNFLDMFTKKQISNLNFWRQNFVFKF